MPFGCALQRVDRSAPDYSSRRGQCAPASPICPSCAQVMRLARMTSRFGDLPDLYTFECRACGVSHIESGFSASITGRFCEPFHAQVLKPPSRARRRIAPTVRFILGHHERPTKWRPGHIGFVSTAKRALLDATISARPHDGVGLPAQPLHLPDPMDTPSSRTDRVRFATVPASRERRSRTPP